MRAFLKISAGAFMWVCFLQGCSTARLRDSTSAQTAEAAAARSSACDTLRTMEPNAFARIEPGESGPIHAYVNKGFYELPIYSKETALKAVALCYLDAKKPEQGVIMVHDQDSGKVIGKFDVDSGLSLQ